MLVSAHGLAARFLLQCLSWVERYGVRANGRRIPSHLFCRVKAVKVSQPKGLAEVTFDASKTNREAIAKSITDKTGFKAEVYGTRK